MTGRLDILIDSDFPRQQWVFAGNYDIPFGKGSKYGGNTNRFVNAVSEDGT